MKRSAVATPLPDVVPVNTECCPKLTDQGKFSSPLLLKPHSTDVACSVVVVVVVVDVVVVVLVKVGGVGKFI